MKLNILDNKKNKLISKLTQELENAYHFDAGIAFATYSGFLELESSLKRFFKRGGSARLSFDISQGITDPELIEELITYPGDCSVRLSLINEKRGFNHVKLYIIKQEKYCSAIVGSHNFTQRAFRSNVELSVYLQGEHGDSAILKIEDFFEREIWSFKNSFNPRDFPEIFFAYQKSFKKHWKKQKNGEIQLDITDIILKDLEPIYNNSIIGKDFLNNQNDFYYLSGLIVASAHLLKKEDVLRGVIKLGYKSQVRGNDDTRGYLAAKIDGIWLANIKLPQQETQVEHFKRVALDLKNFLKLSDSQNDVKFDNRSDVMTNVLIEILLVKNSTIYQEIKKLIDNFSHDDSGHYIPNLPDFIFNSSKENRISFLQGYAELRGRVSEGDRTGTHGKLRCALQISTQAKEFSNQLKKMLSDTINQDSVLADGTERERDHILRFYPNEYAFQIFRLGANRALASAFHDYNNVNFA